MPFTQVWWTFMLAEGFSTIVGVFLLRRIYHERKAPQDGEGNSPYWGGRYSHITMDGDQNDYYPNGFYMVYPGILDAGLYQELSLNQWQ